jgi:hypothetical protein
MKSENKMDFPSETQASSRVVGALRILGFFSALGAVAAMIGGIVDSDWSAFFLKFAYYFFDCVKLSVARLEQV